MFRSNKKWEDWWNNIGLYYGKEIPLEDSFEDSFGDTLSLTRYLKDCTSAKPIIEDEEKFLSYEVSGIKPKDSCKILAPNVSAKCLDIKIINLLRKYLRMTPIMESHIYGIFELADKNKIILPLKMNYVVEKKTETKTSEAQAEISSFAFADYCTDEDIRYSLRHKYWENEKIPKDVYQNAKKILEDTYKFGLGIQKAVEDKDMEKLLSYVRGELIGQELSFFKNKSFDEIFTEEFRSGIISEKFGCQPIGWRGWMIGNGKIWYNDLDFLTIIRFNY